MINIMKTGIADLNFSWHEILSESGFGHPMDRGGSIDPLSPLGFTRLASPGPPEDFNRRESFDMTGRAWNELEQEDLIELM
jgi:hypothetical protein